MTDAPGMRPSDADRQRVVEVLTGHAADGRLTLEELEERAEVALHATTAVELARLTEDLPPLGGAPAPAVAGPRRDATRLVVSVMGGSDRRGRWRVGRRLAAVALLGGCDLDLRGAELDPAGVTINVLVVMGGVDVYVPDSVEVEVGGVAVVGGNHRRGSPRPPRVGAPRVRVRAFAVVGGVDAWRLPTESAGMSLKQARRAGQALEGGGEPPPPSSA